MDAKRKAELKKENEEINITLENIQKKFIKIIQQEATKNIRTVIKKWKNEKLHEACDVSNKLYDYEDAINADLKA